MLKDSPRNQVALILSIISIGLLIPGLLLSMLHIQTTGAVEAPLTNFDIRFFDTNNSIISTIRDLFNQGFRFVACMIFIFSVVVPAAKIFLLIHVICMHHSPARLKLIAFLRNIGKWSMCDVFIVAIFLAYLSTGAKNKGETHEASVLGIPIDIDVLVRMDASLESGFYFFLAYCLTSLIAIQFFEERPSGGPPSSLNKPTE